MKQQSVYSLSGFPANEPNSWPSIGLAALVHVLLLGFLWIGVQWQNSPTTAVEAEVWDMTTRAAAPKPVEVEAQAEREPEPLPKVAEPPKEDPEIALEQDRRRKLAEQKREEERLKQALEAKKKEKLAEEKRKTEQKKEQDAKTRLAEQKKQQAKEQQARDKIFAENMRRLTGQAATSGSGGTGTAARSSGNNRGDPGYGAKIAAKVRSNTVFGLIDNSGTNPTVEYRIELLPDGSLRGPMRKLKSSGVPGFDEAVAKGIEKSSPFPRDKSGEVPASIDLVYRMKEE